MRTKQRPLRITITGTTMVEVLVAILVTSFGLLSLGLTQARLLVDVTRISHRQQAWALSQEILPYLICREQSASSTSSCTTKTDDSPAIAEWHRRVSQKLPSGIATIERRSPATLSSSTFRTLHVRISWLEPSRVNAPADETTQDCPNRQDSSADAALTQCLSLNLPW